MALFHRKSESAIDSSLSGPLGDFDSVSRPIVFVVDDDDEDVRRRRDDDGEGFLDWKSRRTSSTTTRGPRSRDVSRPIQGLTHHHGAETVTAKTTETVSSEVLRCAEAVEAFRGDRRVEEEKEFC